MYFSGENIPASRTAYPFNPYASAGLLKPETKTKIEVAQKSAYQKYAIVLGKFNFYRKAKNYPVTEEGLTQAARDISADMIRAKMPISVSEVEKILRHENYFALLKEKIKETIDAPLRALRWIGLGVLGGLVAVVGIKTYQILKP